MANLKIFGSEKWLANTSKMCRDSPKIWGNASQAFYLNLLSNP